MSQRIRLRYAGAPIAVAVASLLSLSGCAAPATQSAPTVDFGSASVTPGMAGMGAMSAMPQASVAPPAPAAPVAGDAIAIDNFAFVPATLTVKAGGTVTWTNHDEDPHTVVAGGGAFRSPAMSAGGTYSYTFAAPGTFDYVCSIHPFMHGTVVVTP